MASDTDTTATELTPATILDDLESALADQDKVEVSDEAMQALGLWSDDDRPTSQPTRRPVISTRRDNVPVTWQLVDISDVDGRDHGDYLALEVHDKQQGPRHTIPYAIGVGTVSFEPAKVPSLATMRSLLDEASGRRDVAVPDDDALATIRDELATASVEVAQHMLSGGTVWASAIHKTTIHVEPNVSRWEGFDQTFEDLGLSDAQIGLLQDVAHEWSHRPSTLDVNDSFSFSATLSFE